MNDFQERELLEKIDRYLLGQMSHKEETNFEEQIENDTELKREVEEARSFLQVMKQPPDEKLDEQFERTKEIMQEIRQTTKVDYDNYAEEQGNKSEGAKIATMYPKLKGGMSAAAVLLLLVVPAYFIFFYQSPSNQLFNQYYQPATNKLTDQPRGEAAEIQDLKSIMKAYESKEYDVALKETNEYLDGNPSGTDELIFYRGVMHLELNNHQKALKDFREAKEKNEEYRDQALWYLALTHLDLGEKSKAKRILQQLEQRPPSRFTQKARKLMVEME